MESRDATVARVRGAGLHLAVRHWPGDGPPLVLLHGITGSSVDWQAVATRLSARRLIAFDARGHGASDWDPEENYTVDMHFADLASALDDLGIERCFLAGFSMGGGTAILTAACLPGRVSGLAVIDAYPHPHQTPGSARTARWVAERAHETRSFDPAIGRRFRELLAEGFATRADLRSAWAAVECPAFVIRGETSDVLPSETAREMVELLPHASLTTVAGVAHGIPYQRPAELAELLAEFAEAEVRGSA